MTDIHVRLPDLHPGQKRRRDAITAAKARFVVTMAGRRTGKTIDAGEWLMDGAMQGMKCGFFAPTYKYLLDPWTDMSNRLRPLTEAAGGKISEQDRRITLPNGGVIECWTMDTPDPGRGKKYHRIVVDEAGIVRNLKTTWEQALRPTLVDYRGDAWFYGTPKGRTHDFTVLFAKGESDDAAQREPGWFSFRAPTKENPYIPADEIEAARKDMSPEAFAQEFEGIPADDGANPFGLTAIRACVAPMSVKPPVVWGWDFARAQDWTVGIALDENGAVCRFHRWQLKPWGETVRLVSELTGPIVIAYGDSTGIGDVIVEQIQAQRVRMAGVHFSRPEKQQLMERLTSAIQRQTIKFPDGPIKQELDTFQYEFSAFGVRYECPDGLHDDCVMALALAVKGLPVKRAVRAVIDRTKQQDRAPHFDYAKRKFDVLTVQQDIDKAFGDAQPGRIGRNRVPRQIGSGR
jgi:hypothetical protein